MHNTRTLTVEVWRQSSAEDDGRFVAYDVTGVTPATTVLELLDLLNEQLPDGEQPVKFDDGCREGSCGKCGVMVDGVAHGPEFNTTTCQQHVRAFRNGQRVRLEPLRAEAFPVLQDLAVDKKKSLRTVVKAARGPAGMKALTNAGCISCGACVAVCPNGSGQLFVGSLLTELPPLMKDDDERRERTEKVIETAGETFGPCSTLGDCTEVCPAGLPLENLSAVAREYLRNQNKTRHQH
ncbi:succinate dehydrogenase/fumarate reductase iron-sulfur subunit [Kocuria coralli]|uniref:Succinate dehydrogenase/fumarate reductase iron-sulfur subunit n=1 Tax=Kocuria coralli TaxID=1461025 RepID=A0A5J5KY54_9MICC|nr:succinate dehydrogenase/fumarate reductase iron-sulfur subunit [Kocuria coralli]KAA9394358.1 succinate dehydrogenase/fumarate reductase iron-sulfur subunit [Kocuria coralli]